MILDDSMWIVIILLLVPFSISYIFADLRNLIPFLLKLRFPLSQVPGPKLASWTRFWWLNALYHRQTAEELVRLDKTYGPIVRISPNSIIVSDPETTRKVLAVGSRFTRGPWFDSLRLNPHVTNVVSERDSKKHQQLRGILSAGLSAKDVRMETTINEHVRKWIDIINSKFTSTADREVQLDLSKSLPFLTLDIITDLCLGESFHCLENDAEPYGFLEALQTGVIAQQYISVLLELKNLLFFVGRNSFIRSRLFPNMKNKTGIGRVMRIIHQAVERRLGESSENHAHKGDMLDSFLSKGLTLDQASTELIVVLTSGVGSVSYAGQGIIRCIIANSQVFRKLQNEIDETIVREKAGRLDNVEDSTLSQMPYLQACIAEGLRVFPPIFLLRERQVPLPGDILHGYRVPGGTFIGLNALATQLHPVYGDHPEEFHPERWLINDKVQLRKMHRNLELVFGYGGSKCLGVNMANMELNKIIFEVFRNYNISFVNPESPWKAKSDFALSDFYVRIERREISPQTNGI